MVIWMEREEGCGRRCANDRPRVQLEATDRAALRSVDLEDLRTFAVGSRES